MICRKVDAAARGALAEWELVSGDRTEGGIAVFSRAVYLSGERVQCAWIDGPFSAAEDSRIEKALLQSAVEYVRTETDLPLCMSRSKKETLFTEEGFLMREAKTISIAIDPDWKKEAFFLRPAEEKDAIWLRGLYSLYMGAYDAAIVREREEYWQEQVLPRLQNLRVICKEDTPLGYIAFEKRGDTLGVTEFAAHPDHDILLCAIALATDGEKTATVPAPLAEACGQKVEEKEIYSGEEKLFFRVNAPFLLINGRVNDELPAGIMQNIVLSAGDAFR